MPHIVTVLTVLSAVLFVGPQCLRRARWLIIYASLFALAVIYLHYDATRPRTDDLGDGPGAVVGYVVFMLAVMIGTGGILTRAVTLWQKRKDISPLYRHMTTLGGLLVTLSVVMLA